MYFWKPLRGRTPGRTFLTQLSIQAAEESSADEACAGEITEGNARVAELRGAEAADQRFVHLALALALLGLLPWWTDAWRIARQGYDLLSVPYPTCATETYVYDGIRTVAEGRPLYPPIDGLPWALHIYHPLTYLPGGLIARHREWSAEQLWLAGRIIPYASAWGIVLLVAYYLYRRGQDWRPAALGAAMVVYYHSSTLTDFFRNRPETPAILLALAGWMLVQLRPRGWLLWAALCCAASIGFKQTMLAAPTAIVLELALERRWRATAAFALVTGTLVAALVALCFTLGGSGYYQHAVEAMQSNPIRPWAAARHFYPLLLREHWGVLPAVCLVAVVWLLPRRRYRGLLVYLGVCLVLTSVAHGKVGADVNYHAELSLLMVLTAAAGIADMTAQRARLVAAPLAMLVVATWLAIAWHGPGWNHVSLNRAHPRPHGYERSPPFGNLASHIARYEPLRGQLLSLNNEIAVRVGDPAVFDWLALKLLVESGQLDFEQLLDLVRQQHYRAIVLDRSFRDAWTERLEATAYAHGYRRSLTDEHIVELTVSPLPAPVLQPAPVPPRPL